jgi:hypothetical protein
MEVVGAIGLVTNIIQLVEVGGKIIKNVKEVRHSALGVTEENRRLLESARRLRELSTRIKASSSRRSSSDYHDLQYLA